MPTIADIKAQYPELASRDDDAVVDAMQRAFYPDLPRERVAAALGVTPRAAEAAAPRSRTWGEAASDTGRGLMSGLAGLVRSGGSLYGLATGDMDNAASELGKNAQEYWTEGQSDVLKERIAQRQARIDAADGLLGKFGAAAGSTLTDPALLGDTVATNLATMVPGLAVGRGVMAAHAARAAAAGAPMTAAQALTAAGRATGAAVGVGAAQQAASVSADVYDAATQKTLQELSYNPEFVARVRAGEAPRDAARALGLDAARAAFPPAAAISVAANAIPGGTMLERALVGGAARDTVKQGARFATMRSVAKGGLGEGFGETLEEGGGQFAGNVAQRASVDPYQDLSANVGENAGMGFAGGLAMGGAAGAFHREAPQARPAPRTAGDVIRENLQPTVGPTSAAVNAGIEQAAQAADAAEATTAAIAPVVAPPRPVDEALLATIERLPDEQKDAARKLAALGSRPDVTDGVRKFAQVRLDAMLAPLVEPEEAGKKGQPAVAAPAAAPATAPAAPLNPGASSLRVPDIEQVVDNVLGPAQPAATTPPANPAAETLATAAHEAATSPANDLPGPTDGQKEAGNYRKGHARWQGLDLSFEYPKGSERKGVDPKGKPWTVAMPAHYGYVKRTEGADGEQVDVYMGDNPDSDRVYVVDQQHSDTGAWDEHKAILGANSLDEATSLYDASFSDGKGPQRRRGVTELSVDQFKDWLRTGDTKKPLAAPAANAEFSEEGYAAARALLKSKLGPAPAAPEGVRTEAEKPPEVTPTPAPAPADKPEDESLRDVVGERPNGVKLYREGYGFHVGQRVQWKGTPTAEPQPGHVREIFHQGKGEYGGPRVAFQADGETTFFWTEPGKLSPSDAPLPEKTGAGDLIAEGRRRGRELWPVGPFAERIRNLLDELRRGGADEEANLVEAGFEADAGSGRLNEQGVAHREDWGRKALARLADKGKPAKPLAFEPATLAELDEHTDGTLGALPQPIQDAALAKFNELGEQLAKHGVRYGEVDSRFPEPVQELDDAMRQVVSASMHLAPRRYRATKGYKDHSPAKLEQSEDYASRVLGIDTRAHPGVDTSTPITASGGKQQLKAAPAPVESVVNGRQPPADLPAGERLLLLACSDTKGSEPALARDLYQGPLWQALRKHGKPDGMPELVVLSAKHGFVSGDRRLEPYEQEMTDERAAELLADVDAQADAVARSLPEGVVPRDVYLAGGKTYRGIMEAVVARLIERGVVAKDASVNAADGKGGKGAGIGRMREQLGEYLQSIPEHRPSDDMDDESAEWERRYEQLFVEPERTVRAADVAKGQPVLTKEEGDARLEQWRKAAQNPKNPGLNATKTVLSLFDFTGIWSAPWVEAGYNVVQLDIKNGQDINDLSIDSLNDAGLDDVDVVLAAVPCTDFAASGARWWQDKDGDGRTEASIDLLNQTKAILEYFRPRVWAIENPVGRIKELGNLKSPRLTFDPHHYGDPHTKKTLLYGNFNPDLPQANVEPTEGSKIHRLSSSAKAEREETPEGFAYAFFMANGEAREDGTFGPVTVPEAATEAAEYLHRRIPEVLRTFGGSLTRARLFENLGDPDREGYTFPEDVSKAALDKLVEAGVIRKEGRSYALATHPATKPSGQRTVEAVRDEIRHLTFLAGHEAEERMKPEVPKSYVGAAHWSRYSKEAKDRLDALTAEQLAPRRGQLAKLERELADALAREGKAADLAADPAEPRLYKSRRAAEAARKMLGNTHRLQKVEGGYRLREASDAELAAADRAGQRLKAGRSVDLERDSVLVAIAKLGGLSMDARKDTISEGNRNVGGRMVFRNDGRGIDDMASVLNDLGYVPPAEFESDGGVNWLEGAVAEEYGGQREHFSMQGEAWMNARLEAARGDDSPDYERAGIEDADLARSGYFDVAEDEQQAVDDVLRQAIQEANEAAQSGGQDEAAEALLASIDAIEAEDERRAIEADTAAPAQDDGADTGEARPRGEDRAQPGAEDQGQADAPALTLEAQTPEALREKAAREQAAIDAARAKERAEQARLLKDAETRENKARADQTVDDFHLGQDADTQMSGMGSLFDAPSPAPAPKPRPVVSDNTAFTDDGYAKARALLRSKLGGQLNSGIDPEVLQAGIYAAGYHIEKGARTFAAYARAMLADLGDEVRPFLKSWYAALSFDPRAGAFASDMTPVGELAAIDVDAIRVTDAPEESPDVSGPDADLERNRPRAPAEPEVADDLRGDGPRGGARTPGSGTRSQGGRREGDPGVPDGGTAAGGERGDLGFHVGDGSTGTESLAAGSDFADRSDDVGDTGISPAGAAAETAAPPAGGRAAEATLRAAQRDAERVAVKPGDLANIRETLPYLYPQQQDDVHTAEARFAKPDGYGMLFTNGTGTGKTYSGLGVVKRFVRQGKGNILFVVPDRKIGDDWVESAVPLGMRLEWLADTKSAGQGLTVTTYANLGENDAVAGRQWDLVVVDEAHSLMQSADGAVTLALTALRAITLHPGGAYARYQMLNREDINKVASLVEQMKASTREQHDPETTPEAREKLRDAWEGMARQRDALMEKLRLAREKVEDDVKARQGAPRPRAVFLSATPFAYEKTIDWANGFLFDYREGYTLDETSLGYNDPTPREHFFATHLGYQMRHGRMEEPNSAKVDRGLLQRQFNGWLKTRGALSGRMLDVPADYDRRFVLVDSAIGNRIDQALEWVQDQGQQQKDATKKAGFQALNDAVRQAFNYQARRYLLEAIKATEAVAIVRRHMELGRKVVVFHDYKQGGGFNPFAKLYEETTKPGTATAINNLILRDAIEAFRTQFADLFAFPFQDMPSPVEVFRREFGEKALIINGDEKPRDLLARYKVFQSDATPPVVMLVQSAKNKGWSGHDTTGKHQRVLINLGQPTAPTLAIQQEGRIYRTGQVSNAIFRYLNTGTNWERWAFANTIASRAEATENLGMGEMARALRDSFIQAFEDSDRYAPGHDGEGIGGKAADKASNEAITEYDRAKSFYWATAKKNSKTKAAEGADYFATPEPLGLKMTQWLDSRAEEATLEPSAGHGAIARWLSDVTKRTVIEPSLALRSRLAMVMRPAEDRIIAGTFEGLDVGANKFDGIAMNPPFGKTAEVGGKNTVGGKLAIEHLAKAAQHLRDGGRIVALIPTGPAADKRFDQWFFEEATRPAKPAGTVTVNGQPTEVYVGDSLDSKTLRRNGAIVTDVRDGTVFAKQPGDAYATGYPPSTIEVLRPTGKRTETYRPAAGLHMVADIKLPMVTFERAGTKVATRVVVLERSNTQTAQVRRDLSDALSINDLFDELQHLELPKRSAPSKPAAAATPSKPAAAAAPAAVATGDEVLVEHITKAGKTLRGVVRKGITEADALKVDPYTFRKNGGWFIREKHLRVAVPLQDLSRLGGRIAAQGFEKAEVPRVSPAVRLRRLNEQRAAGKIDDATFIRQVEALTQQLNAVVDTKAANRALADRVRGPDYLRQKLYEARRTGTLSPEAVDFALWLVEKNPALAEDMGVSILSSDGSGAAGRYEPVSRVIKLFSNGGNVDTAVHEILHHTERMMPEAIQAPIRRAWLRAYAAAHKAAPTDKVRAALDFMLMSSMGDAAAHKRVIEAFADGTLDYDTHYQLVNASEFWAVNATRLMARRHAAGTWLGRARAWLAELVQKMRGWLRMRSDKAVLDGLEAVLRGDGTFRSPRMLVEGRGGLEQPLTTMVPTIKGATVDPAVVKVPGIAEALADDPKAAAALAANVALFNAKVQEIADELKRGYNSIKVEGSTPQEQAESIIGQMVRNLLTIYDAIPPDVRDRSRLWYDGANRISLAFAERYGMTPMQAAGQLAVLSPQADWFMNVSYAERINDILEFQQDHTWDEGMEQWADAWMEASEPSRQKEADRRADAVRDAERGVRAAVRARERAEAALARNTPKLEEKIEAAQAALDQAHAEVVELRKAAKKSGDKADAKRLEKAEAAEAALAEKAKAARAELREAKGTVGKAGTAVRQAEKRLQERREFAAQPDLNVAVQPDLRGKKLSELPDDFARAWWVRTYDEVHHPRAYRIVTPEGGFLGFAKNDDGVTDGTIAWKSFLPIAKAISIRRDGSMENVHTQLGGEHKVRNFYNNIYAPDAPHPFVTSDTHQVAANLFLPLGADALEVGQNFGGTGSRSVGPTGLNGTYWLYSEAVARAAAEVSAREGETALLPREMQSISWEAIRSLFSPTFKGDADSVNAVRDLWDRHHRGEASYEDTVQSVIDLAGGRYRDPSWVGVRPDSAGAPEAGAKSYESKLAPGRQGLGGRDGARPRDEGHARPDVPGGRRGVEPGGTVLYDLSRRNLLLGAAAAAAPGATRADTTLGRARPVDAAVWAQPLPAGVAKALRGNGATEINGAPKILAAVQELARSGPAELRALASQVAGLLPGNRVMLTVDDRRVMNAHGAVTWGVGGPHLQLFTAGGRTGMTYGTFLHESLHLAVLARYEALSTGLLRSNDRRLGVAAPGAAAEMAQFRALWEEFQSVARDNRGRDEDTEHSVQEAAGSPDEFFVRALTDGRFQTYLAGLEYKGKSLLERFKDWVTGLFVKSGTRPSWLDAALLASGEFAGAMGRDKADYARMEASKRLSSSQRSAVFSRASPDEEPGGVELLDIPRRPRSLRGAINDARDFKLPAGYQLGDLLSGATGRLHWWHKTVGTQFNLAARSRTFRRVYDTVQEFLHDVSRYANAAADRAPTILPKLETWRDIAKSPLSAADTQVLGRAVFEGTLLWTRDEDGQAVRVDDESVPASGTTFSPEELRDLFGANDRQVGLYIEFRRAIERSINDVAITEMLALGGRDVPVRLRERVLASADPDAVSGMLMEHFSELGLAEPRRADVHARTIDRVQDAAAHAKSLRDRGYAPLTRFGTYSLTLRDEEGDVLFFGLYETPRERARARRQLAEAYPEAEVDEGTVAQAAHKLFAGVSPETLELFGELLGLDATGDDAKDQAFQQYIKLTTSTRSTLRRLIHRKGIAGYSEDAGRVLAGFVTSNARRAASNVHMGELDRAVDAIPQLDGQLRDHAEGLRQYVQNPAEEAQAVRGLLFAQYLGGSIASAMVNLTQPFTVTAPWLSQYGGAAKAGARLARATADALRSKLDDDELQAALKEAEKRGTVAPQEVYHLMGQAAGRGQLVSSRGGTLGDAEAAARNTVSRIAFAWGKVFGIAEQFNRRTTFIAAWRTAVEEGMQVEPAVFAERAVNATQFVYNKGNRPRWARGPIGTVAFTFRHFSINYLELLGRMWQRGGPEGKRAVLYALLTLFLVAGADGLPFVENIDDLLDGFLQRLGYNVSSREKRREFFASVLPDWLGEFASKGLSGLPGVPIDVSGRMSLGKPLPGTGLAVKKADHTRDVLEVAGPIADVAKRLGTATGQLLDAKPVEAVHTLTPVAVRNFTKGVDMLATGTYRDDKKNRVIDTTVAEGVMKMLGFHPASVALLNATSGDVIQAVSFAKLVKEELSDRMAQAMADGDEDARQLVREEVDAWNERNPDTPIKLDRVGLLRRMKERRATKAERIERAAPKNMRGLVRERFADTARE